MKIVISSTGDNLDSQIDPRFGRCKFFIIVETDDMGFESFNNENIALNSGAGIQSASFVASKEAKAVLTGSCGPKAMEVFSKANIEVFTDFAGTVKDAVEKFKKGEIKPVKEANVAEKAGVSNSPADTAMPGNIQSNSFGQGVGGGRGMGGGGRCMGGSGRGMGMGGGRGMGMGNCSPVQASTSKPDTSAQNLSKETIIINANIEITIESLQAIISNAKTTTGQKGEDSNRFDTADKVSKMISCFLHEKDFETYATNIKNYQ